MPDAEGNKKNTAAARFAQMAALLSAVTTLLVAFNTWKVSEFETDLKQVESERELNFRIYQSIAEALESDDARRIRAVRTIVSAMSPDHMKEGFLEALAAGEDDIYKKEEVAVVRQTAISRVPAMPSEEDNEWGGWAFDLFWCSSSGAAAQEQAEILRDALEEAGARGRIRARVLPESRRQQVSDAPTGYEVRGEVGEENISRKLVEFANTALQPNEPFRFVPIQQDRKTAWYISAFLCPEV